MDNSGKERKTGKEVGKRERGERGEREEMVVVVVVVR
jgi:hypothetical protein